MIRALLLADTHLGPGQAPRLVEKLSAELDAADVVLHAGDITDELVLAALADFADVHAVRGNNDIGSSLPEQLVIEVAGCSIAMVHDSGPSTGRRERLRRWFPTADVVVFGHSHIPWHERDVCSTDGRVQHHINPGSATQRRHQPRCTVGWLELDDGRVHAFSHVEL